MRGVVACKQLVILVIWESVVYNRDHLSYFEMTETKQNQGLTSVSRENVSDLSGANIGLLTLSGFM